MKEIRFHGRGGQGAVIASKIISQAAFLEGLFVQSFPQYGVERRGAPVVAFARIEETGKRIYIRSQIYNPDYVIVLDETLFEVVNVLNGLKDGGLVLINSAKLPDSFNIPDNYEVATVDASGIAVNWKLGTEATPIVNTAILGAFVKATGIVKLDSLLKAIEDNVPVKKENNINAAKDAFNQVKILNRQKV